MGPDLFLRNSSVPVLLEELGNAVPVLLKNWEIAVPVLLKIL